LRGERWREERGERAPFRANFTYLAHELLVARARRVERPVGGRGAARLLLLLLLVVRVLEQALPGRLVGVNVELLRDGRVDGGRPLAAERR